MNLLYQSKMASVCASLSTEFQSGLGNNKCMLNKDSTRFLQSLSFLAMSLRKALQAGCLTGGTCRASDQCSECHGFTCQFQNKLISA